MLQIHFAVFPSEMVQERQFILNAHIHQLTLEKNRVIEECSFENFKTRSPWVKETCSVCGELLAQIPTNVKNPISHFLCISYDFIAFEIFVRAYFHTREWKIFLNIVYPFDINDILANSFILFVSIEKVYWLLWCAKNLFIFFVNAIIYQCLLIFDCVNLFFRDVNVTDDRHDMDKEPLVLSFLFNIMLQEVSFVRI